MVQATFSIRIDESLKRQFDALCADFGMNATTSFNVFARAAFVKEKFHLKFRLLRKQSEPPACRPFLLCGMRQRKMVFRI